MDGHLSFVESPSQGSIEWSELLQYTILEMAIGRLAPWAEILLRTTSLPVLTAATHYYMLPRSSYKTLFHSSEVMIFLMTTFSGFIHLCLSTPLERESFAEYRIVPLMLRMGHDYP